MKSYYLIRLDDACEFMDALKWQKMEMLLDKYEIKPIVAVIPHCEDPKFKGVYSELFNFGSVVNRWKKKGWSIALHGYNHKYTTSCKGINPINNKSEFAGVSLETQKLKIRKAIEIFNSIDIDSKLFVAPSHTFDLNTIKALQEESNIRVISDTIASDLYTKHGMTFIPQQSGRCRKLPVKVATFCFHPNVMSEAEFFDLENFIIKNRSSFTSFEKVISTYKCREINLYDKILNKIYLTINNIRSKAR